MRAGKVSCWRTAEGSSRPEAASDSGWMNICSVHIVGLVIAQKLPFNVEVTGLRGFFSQDWWAAELSGIVLFWLIAPCIATFFR